ncbi:PREDICTED: uncharacterized protein LOC108968280 [Bactrocera latifrons]|uniref:uncharacterized protein LOC108968280 n=1 Tax=Bactrocera latifrons TaxID=174628 RepID=UPI0008DD4F38|nr:PREDICTED: uncharacterized protein LOC108968280 [Bactrocera latifrons]
MPFRRCFAHCPHGSAILYPFPPKTDVARRDLWIRQFGKNPDQFKQKHLYACRKHFSSYMTYGKLLRKNGYPDVNLSTYDKDKPYTQRYSYYKPGAKPDPFWHDNLDDVVAMPPLDYGLDLEYVPVECIVPLSNELSQTEDSNSSDDEDIQLKKKSNYVDRKRKCILGCGGKRSLHILPSIHNELERRQKWLYLLGKDPALYTQRHVYVCDLHFDIHMVGKSHLIRGAYPNKNLPAPLIKSIPEGLEAQTECLQKCSDYKRKFKFPTFDRKRRETWLLKFGRNPAFYTNDIYACDRHFSDEMRVGPYLHSHAVPDQNLALKLLHEDNTGNYAIKTWSLERLQALANATTTSLTVTTTTTTQSTTAQISPAITTIPTTTTVISPTDTITDSTTKTVSPTVTTTTTISPTITTTTMISPTGTTIDSPQTPTIDESAQSKNILDQLKITVMSTANQTSQTPGEYIKMKTLGVFMQHRDGYVVPLRQILNAVDPLDCRGYLLTECAKSIEPKITIKVHPIPKEIYEGISEDDSSMPASPTYKDDMVEESDDTKNLKFTHAYDEQNSADSWRHEDNNDYSNSLENAQIYNIKRNKVKFTHAFDEQQNNGELGEQDDHYDYHENNVDELNNFSGNGVNKANAEFALISDPILDQLAETYPTESFSLLLGQNNTVVKCSTETSSESKTEVVIVSDEPNMAGKLLTEKKTQAVNKRVMSVQPKQQLHNSKVLTQWKAATVKNDVIKQQPQQQTNLTKAVALAESWQQVVKTMQKEVSANSTLANMQKQPDAIALAAKKLVEEIKQAGEREKLSIHQKRIAGDLTGTNLNGKQILSTQSASTVATTQVPTKIFNKPDPNAFEITSVEIINSKPSIVAGLNANLKVVPAIQDDPHRAKITSVEIINSKLPTNVVNGNTVTFSERRTPQILQNRKEIMQMMHRPSAAKATIATTTMPLTITKPPFKIPASAAHGQPESIDTIEELLAKAKHILNTKTTAVPANTNNDDDELLKSAEAEIHLAPTSTTQQAEDDDVVPYCVLKCTNFRKIYEFPSPEAQTFQRHFWFIQLGLDIATDWHKILFICDKHFDDTMLLPSDNTLNEYAYPCQSLLRELNKPTATVGTQTCDDAEEYRQKLFDQIAELKQTLCQQKLEVKRVKVLIRLKQEASRLVAEIEEAENAPKLLTIYNKE